jgi:hypothetical protein
MGGPEGGELIGRWYATHLLDRGDQRLEAALEPVRSRGRAGASAPVPGLGVALRGCRLDWSMKRALPGRQLLPPAGGIRSSWA